MDKIISEQSAVGSQPSADDERTLAKFGFYWRERDGVKVLVNQKLDDAGFVNGFSTRVGGVSPFPANSLNLAGFDEDSAENIHENRRRFLRVLASDHRLATAWQIHSNTVKTVRTSADIDNSEERADAIISDMKGVLVGVKTADCVPILIGDPATSGFAAVHAGWRGTVRSIVAKAIDKLIETFHSKPIDLICAIGPAACGRKYEVGPEVIDEFAESFENSAKYLEPTHDGRALIDLHQANRDQLITSGVAPERISIAPFCTMERSDLFFSYRIEKKKFGKTGRLLSVIGRANNSE